MPNHCAYCGGIATHYCNGCGNWVCNSAWCNARAVAATLGFPVKKFGESQEQEDRSVEAKSNQAPAARYRQ